MKISHRIKKLKFKLSILTQKTRWLTYEKDSKKYLVVFYTKHGKTIWSKHFIIEAVADDRGISNDRYDKSVNDWFKPCTTVCDHT